MMIVNDMVQFELKIKRVTIQISFVMVNYFPTMYTHAPILEVFFTGRRLV